MSSDLDLERLSTQFFTDFHKILRVAQKRRWPNAYCFWDKAEVDTEF